MFHSRSSLQPQLPQTHDPPPQGWHTPHIWLYWLFKNSIEIFLFIEKFLVLYHAVKPCIKCYLKWKPKQLLGTYSLLQKCKGRVRIHTKVLGGWLSIVSEVSGPIPNHKQVKELRKRVKTSCQLLDSYPHINKEYAILVSTWFSFYNKTRKFILRTLLVYFTSKIIFLFFILELLKLSVAAALMIYGVSM